MASKTQEEVYNRTFALNDQDRLNLELADQQVKSQKGYYPQQFYKRPVSSFGIIDQDGHAVNLHWVVTKPRKDNRSGVVDPPALRSPWYKHLVEGMFSKW